ncbi:HAMP domain-containing histidine kinase [Jiella sp. MQZ9-1]|uniref:histidine kinase n=1 Tax=Jiella flava TaxID=2816857 RepID=A0A939JVW3_9HYPH|nr:HAMP domain-containing sensor histidine kinase [Jiella flava]MBO0662407.1 HAMP domain-containing histidine kinase [Jiella flava]MCD2471631.1 HAMP domain-containing histidine kinase [Jiella flava]
MRQASKRPKDTIWRVPTAAVRFLKLRLDEYVAPSVAPVSERRFQAGLLRVLLLSSFLVALCFPVLLATTTGSPLTALPLILAALALSSAAWLSLSGRADMVLMLWGTMAAALFGWAALRGAVTPELSLCVLAILPIEALIAKRARLAAGLSVAAVGFGAVVIAAMARAAVVPLSDLMLCLIVALYGIRLAGQAARAGAERLKQGAVQPLDPRFARRQAAEEFRAVIFEISQRGRIDHASSAARALLAATASGPSGGTLTGRLFGEICHVADRLAVMQAIDVARAGGVPATIEARLAAADGGFKRFGLEFAHQGSKDDFEDYDVFVFAREIVVPDAPDETAIRADLEAAREASAAKSRFLATVSHELRTPLNAIIGFSDVLDQEYFGRFESDKQKEYVGLIRHSGKHLLSLVNTLLDVSKIEAGRYDLELEIFDLSTLMVEIGDLMREEARRKDLRIDVRAAPGLDLVADRRACHQILLNLVANAVKFTDAGVVTIESRLHNGLCELLVSDTGIGIAEADLERLGMPFVQLSSGVSRRYEGTGLGLSLVKGLAELHGGRMTVESQPGIGTMVTIALPVAGPAIAAGPSASIPENIVALSDARSKTNSQAQTREERRSA